MSNDWFLEELVAITERTGVGVGVTLFVQGTLVTGSLVNARTYFEGLAALPMEAAGYPELAEAFKELFANTGKAVKETTNESPPPPFIHLQNAHVVAPNGHVMSAAMWWRGRVSAVSGFSLGSLKSD